MPKNTIPEEKKQEVIQLYEEKYHDTNFCHFSQLLEEHENIVISPSSVRRILQSAGKKAKHPQKRRPKKHRPRDRRAQAGMLWQTDATPYEWLGPAFGKFALHAVIDDATGIVTGACFTPNECFEGYSTAMRQGLRKYGIPLALYSDKHTIFRSPNEKLTLDEELDGQDVPLSNFGKAMKELGIEHIKASTPQAKGRVERLWETLQDRLPAELRLLGIKSMDEANKALPKLLAKHNERFRVLPEDNADAYTPLPKGTRLEYVFVRRETRQVGAGGEITYKNNVYVPTDARCYLRTRTTVEIRETFEGEVLIWREGGAIPLKKIERPVRKEKPAKDKVLNPPYKPAAEHPWRKYPLQREQNEARVASPMVV